MERTAREPAIAEVILSESHEVVAVTLVERDLVGVYPDGIVTARALAAIGGCMEVRLSGPLGKRKLIDGSTGRRAREVRYDAREGDDDWFALRAFEGACPFWVP